VPRAIGYNREMIWTGIALLGLGAGWLVNYLADVLPMTRRFSRPACPNCGHERGLVDFLLLRPCRSCNSPRGWRSYLVQAILLIATLYMWLDPSKMLGFWLSFILLIFLAVVFVIDVEHRLILHPVSLTGAVLGLGIGIYLHGLTTTLIGGAVGFGSMLVLYYLGDVFTRYMSKRRGEQIDEVALGFGDVNLAGIIGLLLGYPLVIFGLLFAILVGGAFSLLLVLVMLFRRKYQAFTAIPYGPFLILSVLYALYR
jgi:prepilin signal peptidase PulO-like enzyme (type II secretory pathway)